ncbi:MAG: HAD-IA family hydrolase [Clostridiales bacterium]|nr:HAD-IA family hydrolase [Clostridiales bacterium]
MYINSIIFDLDGTLLDTLDDLTAAVNRALISFSLPPITKATARRYVGNGVPKLIERAVYFATTGNEPDLDGGNDCDRSLVSACLALFTEYYDKHSQDYTAPYAGVAQMLAAVKDMGLKSAIVTNKYDAAARKLKDIFFPTVDLIIGTRKGIRPKPAPDGVNKALELLGSSAARSVYVGDGETDMETAAACGMPVVAVTWGFRDEAVLREFHPNFIIDSPSELFDALRGGGLIE